MALPTIPSNDGSCLIEVRKLFDEISDLNDADLQCLSRRSKICIFRVPKFLKDSNEKAYVPQMVSLGPLHEANKQPSITEDRLFITKADKMRAVVRMLGRCHPRKIEIEDVIHEIRGLEKEIKDCYEVEIPYEGYALASMLTLDGCFILQTLRAATHDLQYCDSFGPNSDGRPLDSVYGSLLLRDIMLLENQIPLVVLIKLLKLELESTEEARHKLCEVLNDKSLQVLIPFEYSPGQGETQNDSVRQLMNDIQNFKHLLDFLRRRIISSFLSCEKGSNSDSHQEDVTDKNISIPSAEILHSVGIEFKPCSDSGIRFKTNNRMSATATLFIPKIRIDDYTETVLRNLIAYEGCRAEADNRISRYTMLIDDFIESKNDVGVLKKASVICVNIGSDRKVTASFDNICTGITKRPDDDLDKIILDVGKHYKNKWKVLVAEFVDKHCSKPWLVISLVAGVMLLVMTLLQTFFAIIDRRGR